MLLDWIGMPYTGSPPQALAHALDKPVARALLAAHGVPVAAGVVLARGDESLAGLTPPWIVKPSREDASHGIHLESVVSDEAAARRLARALIARYRQPALVEEFAPGRELSVSLLGPAQEPTPLPIFEIDYSDFPAAGRSSSPTPRSGTRRATSTGARPWFRRGTSSPRSPGA